MKLLFITFIFNLLFLQTSQPAGAGEEIGTSDTIQNVTNILSEDINNSNYGLKLQDVQFYRIYKDKFSNYSSLQSFYFTLRKNTAFRQIRQITPFKNIYLLVLWNRSP